MSENHSTDKDKIEAADGPLPEELARVFDLIERCKDKYGNVQFDLYNFLRFPEYSHLAPESDAIKYDPNKDVQPVVLLEKLVGYALGNEKFEEALQQAAQYWGTNDRKEFDLFEDAEVLNVNTPAEDRATAIAKGLQKFIIIPSYWRQTEEPLVLMLRKMRDAAYIKMIGTNKLSPDYKEAHSDYRVAQILVDRTSERAFYDRQKKASAKKLERFKPFAWVQNIRKRLVQPVQVKEAVAIEAQPERRRMPVPVKIITPSAPPPARRAPVAIKIVTAAGSEDAVVGEPQASPSMVARAFKKNLSMIKAGTAVLVAAGLSVAFLLSNAKLDYSPSPAPALHTANDRVDVAVGAELEAEVAVQPAQGMAEVASAEPQPADRAATCPVMTIKVNGLYDQTLTVGDNSYNLKLIDKPGAGNFAFDESDRSVFPEDPAAAAFARMLATEYSEYYSQGPRASIEDRRADIRYIARLTYINYCNG